MYFYEKKLNLGGFINEIEEIWGHLQNRVSEKIKKLFECARL